MEVMTNQEEPDIIEVQAQDEIPIVLQQQENQEEPNQEEPNQKAELLKQEMKTRCVISGCGACMVIFGLMIMQAMDIPALYYNESVYPKGYKNKDEIRMMWWSKITAIYLISLVGLFQLTALISGFGYCCNFSVKWLCILSWYVYYWSVIFFSIWGMYGMI